MSAGCWEKHFAHVSVVYELGMHAPDCGCEFKFCWGQM